MLLGEVALCNAFCQNSIEFFLIDFFIGFYNALFVYTLKTSVFVIESTNRVDCHPTLGNKKVAKVDAFDVVTVTVGIVKTTTNCHNSAKLVGGEFHVSRDIISTFLCNVAVACQSKGTHNQQKGNEGDANAKQYFFQYFFHTNLTV